MLAELWGRLVSECDDPQLSDEQRLVKEADSVDVCLTELIRQVKVHCKERGDLLALVWEQIRSMLHRATQATAETSQVWSRLRGILGSCRLWPVRVLAVVCRLRLQR